MIFGVRSMTLHPSSSGDDIGRGGRPPESALQTDPGRADESARMLPAIKELALVGAAVVAVCGGLAFWIGSSTPGQSGSSALGRNTDDRDEPVAALFVGDAVCAECHPGESAAHRRSGHSRTLRRAGDLSLASELNGKTVRDEEFDATWEFALKDGAFATTRTEQGKLTRLVLEYAFGSGEHATTFVSLTDRTPSRPSSLEHRLTFFHGRGELGTTPGQTKDTQVDPHELTPSGRVLGPEKTLECFGCHTTLLSAGGGNELDTASMIANVSCERCHGPARGHVDAARRHEVNLKMPFGPDRSNADLQMRHCGFCHRHPEMAPAGAINPENPSLARFQPVGLMQSKCYTRTSGGLACTACHDPHARASANRERYETACLDCHKSPPRHVCPVSPAKGCVSCHMPLRDAGQGVLFHDHWIRLPSPPLPVNRSG
jgi:hypothetical protein